MGCNGKYFLDGTVVKNPCAVQERQVQSLGWKDAVEKEMVIHSCVLAWEIPQTEEPGGLQFMGSQRIKYDFATKSYLT